MIVPGGSLNRGVGWHKMPDIWAYAILACEKEARKLYGEWPLVVYPLPLGAASDACPALFNVGETGWRAPLGKLAWIGLSCYTGSAAVRMTGEARLGLKPARTVRLETWPTLVSMTGEARLGLKLKRKKSHP